MTKITLHSLGNANQTQKDFDTKAIRRLKAVLNDEAFISRVSEADYSGRKFKIDDGTETEATNEQILEIISTGKERKSDPDNEVDLQIKLSQLDDEVAGSVTPPSRIITTSTSFFNDWMESKQPLSLAAHWMHEWLHVAGFRHVKINGKPDSNDVGYSIGRFVVEVGRQHLLDDGVPHSLVALDGQGYLDSSLAHLDTVHE